jgi:hypothetical protein
MSNPFEEFTLTAHRESVAMIGERFLFRGETFRGIFSEIEKNNEPEVAGYAVNLDGRVTAEMAEIKKASGSARIQGERITRVNDNTAYRIDAITDNGGGLVDLNLQSVT